MREIDSLKSMNHNLLPVLRALLRECNVTRAAEIMGMTQPAASAALAKLRLMLNDALLVKKGRRMELSPRAAQLLPQVEDLCSGLERLWQNPKFDPATADRCFSLTCPDYIEVIIASPLMRLMATQAPRMSLRFLDIPFEDVTRSKVADVDFVMGIRQIFEHPPAATGFIVQTLYHDRIVAVIGPKHRLYAAKNVNKKDYEDDPFLVFIAGAQFLEKRYDALRTAVRVPGATIMASQHYNSLMLIAMQGDAIALVPRRLAQLAQAATPLRILDPAYSDFDVDICLAWDQRFEFDEAHGWFRACIQRAAQSLKRASPVFARADQ
jgi:LysR family nod box-dependent transcriptional activator